MLLTLPRPVHAEFEFKHAHDFIPPPPISIKRSFVKADQEILPSLQAGVPEKMGTPHRGLPPPSAMTLPDPGRAIPPPLSNPFVGMPEPPRQWQGAEEAMGRWLLTKAEEEKRKQEEERTRQESLKLEQRRIEQTILLDALRSGVPPQLVPIIFAGIGSHSVANLSIEWLQQYNNSLHAATQQQHTGQAQSSGSPEIRRERLVVTGPPQYALAQPAGVGRLPPDPRVAQASTQYPYSSNPMSPTMGPRQPSGPPSSSMRGPLQQVLPRIATNEQHAGAPPPVGPGAAQQPPPTQAAQQEQSASSPSSGLFFHHWIPPSSQGGSGNPPPTPSEYTNSPKRRKAQAPQPSTVPPTSEPRYNSTSFVHITSPAGSTSGGRKRRLSDTSAAHRGGYPSSGRKNRSRGNTESSAAISEEDRLRYRQYPVGGPLEDRGDIGNHSSNYNPVAKRSRRSYDQVDVSDPSSPKRAEVATALSSQKSSVGAAG